MEIRDLARLARRWWRLSAIYVMVGAVASLLVSGLTKPIYMATTTLVVTQDAPLRQGYDYTTLLGSERLANTYSQVIGQRPVLERVISNLKLDVTPGQLLKKVKATVVKDTQLVTLSVEASSPGRAVDIANEIAEQLNVEVQNRRAERYRVSKSNLQQELDKVEAQTARTQAQLEKLSGDNGPEAASTRTKLQSTLGEYRAGYETLLKSYQDVRLAEAKVSNNIVAAEAQAGSDPIRPRVFLDLLLAVAVAFALSVAVALILERLDDSVRSPEDVSLATGLATLGMVGESGAIGRGEEADQTRPGPPMALAGPRSRFAEAFRVLRTNLEFAQLDYTPHTLVIASCKPREGKTTVAANLAVIMAQSGRRVLLVDANLRHPTLHSIFGQSNAAGLTSALLAPPELTYTFLRPSGVARLGLLPAGPMPPNSTGLMHSKRMADMVGELSALAELVIFDTPPMLSSADATLLAGVCDAVLLVAQAGSTGASALRKANEELRDAGARVLGVLLNRVPVEQQNSYYYYSDDEGGQDRHAPRRASFVWPRKQGWARGAE